MPDFTLAFTIRKVRAGSSGWGTQYAVNWNGHTVGYVSKSGSGRSYRRWEGHRANGAPLEGGRTYTYGGTRQDVAEAIVRQVHRETVGPIEGKS